MLQSAVIRRSASDSFRAEMTASGPSTPGKFDLAARRPMSSYAALPGWRLVDGCQSSGPGAPGNGCSRLRDFVYGASVEATAQSTVRRQAWAIRRLSQTVTQLEAKNTQLEAQNSQLESSLCLSAAKVSVLKGQNAALKGKMAAMRAGCPRGMRATVLTPSEAGAARLLRDDALRTAATAERARLIELAERSDFEEKVRVELLRGRSPARSEASTVPRTPR